MNTQTITDKLATIPGIKEIHEIIYRFVSESAPPFRVEVNRFIVGVCSVVGCTGVWFRFPLRRSYRSSSCGSIGGLPTGIGVGGHRGRA